MNGFKLKTMKAESQTRTWSLVNKGDLYTIKLTDLEGSESITATTEQLQELLGFLNSLNLPLNENELPL